MPDRRGLQRILILSLLALLATTLGCDEEPPVASPGAPATAGDIRFELADYHIRYLELTDEDGQTLEYDDPVLAIEINLTNVGEDPFNYSPTHHVRELAKDRTPMLMQDPGGPEVDWDTFVPDPIAGVELGAGQWDRQLQDPETLGPGDSLSDTYLFELPDSDTSSLMLSIPPSMHRGEVPAFLRFDYSEPAPEGPAVYDVGDDIDFDGISFRVTDIDQLYLEMEDRDDDEGYSSDAVLKIAYTLTNDADETITFDPEHRDLSGNRGAILQSLHTDFHRAYFPGSPRPVGQLDEATEVEPGETVEDFAVFERPQDSADNVTFVLNADHFERSGRVRVSFSYTPEDIELPEALQEDDDNDD